MLEPAGGLQNGQIARSSRQEISFSADGRTVEECATAAPAAEAAPAADPPRPGLLQRIGRHVYRQQSGLTGLLADKRRLVAEVRAMEERCGDRARLCRVGNRLHWEYTVVESGRRFPIEVRYPRRYPFEPPHILSVLPLPSSPHQLVDNELCWLDRTSRGDWNPSRDTAAICILAAHRWFACLLVYITVGEWPEGANDEPKSAI